MTTEPNEGQMRNVIVVGVDGSASSEQALRWAQTMAATTTSTIEVVTAWVPHIATRVMSVGPDAIPLTGNAEQDARASLTATVDKVFGDDKPQDLTLSVRRGSPVEVLIEASKTAQLLVVGSRGFGGFAALMLGSVSSACSAHARCPVVIMHSKKPKRG